MKPFMLASREYKPEDTIIEISSSAKKVFLGEGYCTIIAGPCAVEGAEQYLSLARILADLGVHILRAGIFKPRTSPYSFKGLGSEGMDIVDQARMITGLPVITEIMDVRDLERSMTGWISCKWAAVTCKILPCWRKWAGLNGLLC